MVTTLIAVTAIAWLTQLAPSGRQTRHFSRTLSSLCQQGRVGAGRSSGRFEPRAIVAIVVDGNDHVCGTLLTRGLTVSVGSQKIPTLTGKHLKELQPDVIFPNDLLCQNVLSLALNPKYT